LSPARHHHALPDGYQLHWYEIDSILGQGGFGITYLARDTNLDQLVAIKEFLPSDLAVRTQDSAVHPLSGSHTDTYGWGLSRFLDEARTLAKFRHPNIVRVMSVFEANNTAYMVMEYERGESFENLLRFKQVNGEAALKNILLALLDGLELVHASGFIHRDIKPSNVYLREDGVPVLLDFGSARLALGVETRTLTSLVSPGYAPFEQYNDTRENDKQGPWTDIYALGATMYRALTGHGPTDAAARANSLLDEQRDPYQPCSQLGLAGYSREFLQAIDRALAFSPGDRPQSVPIWRQLVVAGAVDTEAQTVAVDANGMAAEGVDFILDGDGSATAATHSATRTVAMADLETASESAPPAHPSARRWFIATSAVAVAGIAVAAWLSLNPVSQDDVPPPEPTAAAPAPSPSVVAVQSSDESRAETSMQSADIGLPETAKSDAVAAPAPAENVTPEKMDASFRDNAAPEAATSSAVAPSPEPPAAKRVVQTPTLPAASANVTPAPPPPNKAPEKIARAAPPPAPTRKSSETTPAPKTTTSKKSAQPRTREEKIAALLVAADENMRADRLTKPNKSNALSDYLTVLAMDKNNDTAHQGVERIASLYVTKARKAIEARQFEWANDHLREARFVLDAMKLRKWPQATYGPLFTEYRETNSLLAAVR
jgi:hypothetical protein